MATSKRELEKAYDALSSSIQYTMDTVTHAQRMPAEESAKAVEMVQNCLAVQRARGASLIEFVDSASARCGAELIAMCERLIDKSVSVLEAATAE